MKTRSALALFVAVALAAPVAAAPPRDEALRLAPPDFALVVVAQNLRDHVTAVSESPFASWFPTTALGKQVLAGANIKQITDSSAPVFAALNLTPSDLLHDVIGDAAIFAFTPATDANPNGERSVIIVRPRKPDVLAKTMERLNAIQDKSKELKQLVEHKHAGVTYFERQKTDGASDFYCFCGDVFVFSASQAEVKAAIDRDKTAPTDKPSVLLSRVTKLGVSDAAVTVLINPRPLDGELAARVKAARPEEKAFLTKLSEVWAAVEVGAIYFELSTGVEAGVSVQFDPAKVPAGAKSWLIGPRTPSAVWPAVPNDAIAAVAGRVKANDLFEFLTALNPPGAPGIGQTVEQALGPLVGKDKLPLVLDALGPDWGAWLVPPAAGSKDTLPAAVVAVKVRSDGEKGADVERVLAQSLEYGFQVARTAYNAKHKDQIELREEQDGDVVVRSLTGDGLPAGFRPCFALKGGYLLVSTSPARIKEFKPPTTAAKVGEAPFARFSGAAARGYLSAHGPALAKLLSSAGAGDEKELAQQFGTLSQLLEPVEKVEMLARGDATGVKLSLRLTPAKPLKRP